MTRARLRDYRNTIKGDPILVAVYGGGRLPLDCLRYDACVPHEQSDAHEADDGDAPRLVILRCYSRSGWVTPDRWRSFCWRVLDVVLADAGDETRATLLSRARGGLGFF